MDFDCAGGCVILTGRLGLGLAPYQFWFCIPAPVPASSAPTSSVPHSAPVKLQELESNLPHKMDVVIHVDANMHGRWLWRVSVSSIEWEHDVRLRKELA